MNCTKCEHETTLVVDSRQSEDNTWRRRRKCEACEHRFTTFETAMISPTERGNDRLAFLIRAASDLSQDDLAMLNSIARRLRPAESAQPAS